jgi:hypothetical protein
MVKGKPEVVTKSEAARRWKVSPAAVTKYLRKGMPALEGGRIDWAAAKAWRAQCNVPTRSGSYKARDRAKEATVAPGVDSDFTVGFATARKNIRQAIPELIASMRPEGVRERIATLAVIDHLLGSWLESPANSKAAMPPIDWSVFTAGIDPKGARALFESLQKDFEAIR